MDDNSFVLNYIKYLEHLDYIHYYDISLKINCIVSKCKSLWKPLWNFVAIKPDQSGKSLFQAEIIVI